MSTDKEVDLLEDEGPAVTETEKQEANAEKVKEEFDDGNLPPEQPGSSEEKSKKAERDSILL